MIALGAARSGVTGDEAVRPSVIPAQVTSFRVVLRRVQRCADVSLRLHHWTRAAVQPSPCPLSAIGYRAMPPGRSVLFVGACSTQRG
jgi:hypothetical protein